MPQENALPPRPEDPLLEVQGSNGYSLYLRLPKYEGVLIFRLFEAVEAVPTDRGVPRPPTLNWDRAQTRSHTRGADGFWEHAEDNGQIAYNCRSRLDEEGNCLEAEVTFINRTAYDWARVSASPCIAPPPAFQDDGLWRTCVVDSHGRLALLGDLVDHYDYNFVSVRGGPRLEAEPGMDAQWHFHNLDLAYPVLMTQAVDGKHTLITAFEQAGNVCTGFWGPCLHSGAMVQQIAAGQQKATRGILALVRGRAKDALDYYLRWRDSQGWQD